MHTPTLLAPGSDATAGQVWVFAVCDSGRVNFVRVFTTEHAADDYAKRWLAEQFDYALTGDETKDWCALDTRCANDESLSWLIACEPVEPAATASTPPVDPDRKLFEQIEAAGASIWVSNTVDHLEMEVRNAYLHFKVDQQSLLQAVLMTAQQRLDCGYGIVAGVRPNPADAKRSRGVETVSGDTVADSDGNTADRAFDEEFDTALNATTVAVEIEAENLVDLCSDLDKARAVRLIVRRLRDNGWTV
ncbi:MAG: hypothetical protein AVDCRST_MAG93-7824 [uncultured Chloroflexia bacterium]|uniref:Uncharacterized protein n=1 Tax=uncultured Chloroflexia bacterium TaxID=1672391 RepID=A0A6J4MPV8_9CHLR|nr:MAG: hypothetical protein AVDCRST_MAG93-7824 [uncultured Chloroflexia bacterium]